MDYEIQKEIPMRRYRGVKRGRKLKYPFDKMGLGDSFSAGKFTKTLLKNMTSISWQYGKRNGVSFTVSEDAEGNVRVWRTK